MIAFFYILLQTETGRDLFATHYLTYMESLPPLFLDLAIILVTAGVITIVFKWLKQPLVLGYIVAGFFIGPYFPWFPAITDDTNIHVWSDIGIVFLMFALGLEFSIKKLKKVGATGAITALTELLLMFLIGNLVGHALGWQSMDCIFLGCMLSISSTTIIIKSFDDLKLKHQKFTSTVTAVLVVEDLIAVLLLVLLSTLSVSKHFDGGELAMSLFRLLFFLIIWFVAGILLVPTLLRWMRRYMTSETLCVVAVGLCFLMVVTASYAGFSTALGAFVMGVILAETIEADVIHRIITPIKNLFGAVFFVSVGMLVDPHILVKYAVPIFVIAATVIIFKSFSATTGVLLSGKPLRTAMQSGFCFCQIGEFSFIIAGVGLSFGVINPDLYPIIVSVSIITTFVTPYMIKAANPVYEKIYPKLPKRVVTTLQRYTDSANDRKDGRLVKDFVVKQLKSIILYSAILLALVLLSRMLLRPLLHSTLTMADGSPSWWGNLLGAGLTLLVMSPFLWAVVGKNISKEGIRHMLGLYSFSPAVVIPLLLLRFFIALFFVGFAISSYLHLAVGVVIFLTLAIGIAIPSSHRAVSFYQHIEERFVSNFNQRQAQQSFKIPEALEDKFSMERMWVTPYSRYVGLRLHETGLRQRYGINVVSIERAGQVYDLPNKDMLIMPADCLSVIGSEEQLTLFRAEVEVEPDMLIHDHSDNEMNIYRLEVTPHSSILGLDIVRSAFQSRYNAMIIAVERGPNYMLNPPADTVFEDGDVVWFVSPDDISIESFDAVAAQG